MNKAHQRNVVIWSRRAWAEEIRAAIAANLKRFRLIQIVTEQREMFRLLEEESGQQSAPVVIWAPAQASMAHVTEVLGGLRSRFWFGPLVLILDGASADDFAQLPVHAGGLRYGELPGLEIISLRNWKAQICAVLPRVREVPPEIWNRLVRAAELESIRADVRNLADGENLDRDSMASITKRLRDIEGALPFLLNHSALRDVSGFLRNPHPDIARATTLLRRVLS